MEANIVKQHPFSLYDFMGYFIPGLYTTGILLIINHLVHPCVATNKSDNILCVSAPKMDFSMCSLIGISLNELIVFLPIYVLFAFIAGQLLSILSNVIIEELPYIDSRRRNFQIILNESKPDEHYGFYILPRREPSSKKTTRDNRITIPKRDTLLLLIKIIPNVLFWLVPIYPFLLVSVIFLSPIRTEDDVENQLSYFDNFFRAQGLSNISANIALNKIKLILSEKFNSIYKADSCKSYFHWICHYALSYNSSHVAKLNNYVALYGFMRNMLMGNVIIFYSLFAFCILSDKLSFWSLMPVGILNILYLYGYLKFIRRFTEETIFAACVAFENNINLESNKTDQYLNIRLISSIKKLFAKV